MTLGNIVLYAVILISVGVSWFIWDKSPDYIRLGGPLLVVGLTCFFMVITFCIERFFVLWRAGGRGSVVSFVQRIRQTVDGGDIADAIDACRKQGGSIANVVGAGLERYNALRGRKEDGNVVLDKTLRTIQQAASLETPHLERNLTALSTLASIATLIGLMGTTIGMIRSFRAMSRAGAPDAAQLAMGISEALVNTALGLFTAILGTVLYNYFSARVDGFNSRMAETSYEVLSILEQKEQA